jgi:hypothetical protein
MSRWDPRENDHQAKRRHIGRTYMSVENGGDSFAFELPDLQEHLNKRRIRFSATYFDLMITVCGSDIFAV